MKKILITGMSGMIGGLLRSHLEKLNEYELTALNRRKVEGIASFQADIHNLEAIKPAFVGQDMVVHLAAQLCQEPWDSMVKTNLIGTRNVYEAARQAGVKRIVYASSGATIAGVERNAPYNAIAEGRYEDVPNHWPIITHDTVCPKGVYGASKVWGEALGRYYSDTFGMSILCARIGSVCQENYPRTPREFAVFLSHRDVVDFLHKCIEAPEALKFDIFFATSRNKWSYRDLEHPRQVLGFKPQDSAESYR
jgi:nucleoside-diphosphate-sugar epimerase